MNEITQSQLEQLLKYIGTLAERADGFVVEQAPLLVREIVAWHMWSSAFASVGAVAGAVTLVFAARWLLRFDWKEDKELKALAILPAGFAVVFSAIAIERASSAIKAAVAPRLVVLEYVQKAVK